MELQLRLATTNCVVSCFINDICVLDGYEGTAPCRDVELMIKPYLKPGKNRCTCIFSFRGVLTDKGRFDQEDYSDREDHPDWGMKDDNGEWLMPQLLVQIIDPDKVAVAERSWSGSAAILHGFKTVSRPQLHLDFMAEGVPEAPWHVADRIQLNDNLYDEMLDVVTRICQGLDHGDFSYWRKLATRRDTWLQSIGIDPELRWQELAKRLQERQSQPLGMMEIPERSVMAAIPEANGSAFLLLLAYLLDVNEGSLFKIPHTIYSLPDDLDMSDEELDALWPPMELGPLYLGRIDGNWEVVL